MVSQRDPDDLCPSCGVPVPLGRRGPECPHCGHNFERPLEGPAGGGYLTTFGYGMCGLVAGGQLGTAVVMTLADVRLGDPRLVLFPAFGATACALLTAGVGSKLYASVRRGYEILLFSLVMASLTVLCLSLVGVSSIETLSAVGGCVLVLGAPVLRRFAYDRKPGSRGQEPRRRTQL